MSQESIEICKKSIKKILENAGILDWMMQQKSIYIGGSIVSYLLCHKTFDDTMDTTNSLDMPHDIDIYTTNHVSSIRYFNANRNNFILSSVGGCIINFSCVNSKSNLRLQFITAEVDNFYDDVLGNYDCDLVCAGYNPHDGDVIIHERLTNACKSKIFNCYKHLSSKSRSEKLVRRAHSWYGGKINYIGSHFGRIDAYYGGVHNQSKSVLNMIISPKYIQLFYNLYKCVACGLQNKKLLCQDCNAKIIAKLNTIHAVKSSVILGGCNGFGKIIGNAFETNCIHTLKTSRFPSTATENEIKFILGSNASNELLERINSSNVFVMNATKTLDGNEKIWNNYIDDFDKSLLFDRIDTNVCGYAKFLNQLCESRNNILDNCHELNKLILVYTDANESKFNGKMIDCKHSELNIAKSGVKQLFYTNSALLAKLNVIVICYDPGWLSYHGISIEKKRSKSQNLIPPITSALGIIDIIDDVMSNFDVLLDDKKIIIDHDVYKFIQKKYSA